MSAAGSEPYVDSGQLLLPGVGPVVGERWRNRNTGSIAVVLGVEQRRHGWVTIRILGEQQTITLATLERVFERV